LLFNSLLSWEDCFSLMPGGQIEPGMQIQLINTPNFVDRITFGAQSTMVPSTIFNRAFEIKCRSYPGVIPREKNDVLGILSVHEAVGAPSCSIETFVRRIYCNPLEISVH